MKDPRPIGETIAALQRAMAAAQRDPDYQRRLAAFEASEARRRAAEREEFFDLRGVPRHPGVRAAAATDEPWPTAALLWVRWALQQYRAEAEPFVMVLAGPPGTGKTTACAWAIAHHSRPAQLVYASKPVTTPDNGWPENAAEWKRWRSADLLVLDEIGEERGDERSCAVLAALLAERFNNGLAVLATTNLDKDTFESRYLNARLVSRLAYGQARGFTDPNEAMAAHAIPWWVELDSADLRDPKNRPGEGHG